MSKKEQQYHPICQQKSNGEEAVVDISQTTGIGGQEIHGGSISGLERNYYLDLWMSEDKFQFEEDDVDYLDDLGWFNCLKLLGITVITKQSVNNASM